MSDPSKPVEKKDEPPSQGWIGIPPIEKDKKRKNFFDSAADKGQFILLAAFFQFMKKILNIGSDEKKGGKTLLNDHHIVEDLISFRKMLQILSNEDQSHNAEFTQQFSEIWNNLAEHRKYLEMTHKKNPLLLSQLQSFMLLLERFPPSEEHSLGYYLSHHVGNEWLPFPCMEILTKLHAAYQQDSQASPLALWIRVIDDILKTCDIPLAGE